MSHVLTETDEFTATVTVPDGVDSRDHAAEDVEAIAQALANRTHHLNQHVARVDAENTFTEDNTFAGTVHMPSITGNVRIHGGFLEVDDDVHAFADVNADDDVNAASDVSAGGNFFYSGTPRTRSITLNPCNGMGPGLGTGSANGQAVWLASNQHGVWPLHVPHGVVLKGVFIKFASTGAGTTVTCELYRRHTIDIITGGDPTYQMVDQKFGTVPGTGNLNLTTLTWGNLVASSLEDYTLHVFNSGSKDLYIQAIQFVYDETVLTTHGSR